MGALRSVWLSVIGKLLGWHKRVGVQYVGSLPDHEGIIGMTHYRWKILIAGDRGHLYELKADKGLNGYEYTLISRGLSMDTRAVDRDLT